MHPRYGMVVLMYDEVAAVPVLVVPVQQTEIFNAQRWSFAMSTSSFEVLREVV